MDVRQFTHTRFVSTSASHGARRTRFVHSVAFLALLPLTGMVTGCGDTTAQSDPSGRPSGQPEPAAARQVAEPAVVVSQFLDRVRRGGNDAQASELLTKLAQQEMTRIGRPLQFPGSPDTTYRVGQSVQVPDQSDTVWVQTILSEPTGRPEPELATMQYEVVWTLRSESDQWRITGFAIDQGNGMAPLEIDFENGTEMQARLAAMESDETSMNR